MPEKADKCPQCESENVLRNLITTAEHRIVTECECFDCGAEWEEV